MADPAEILPCTCHSGDEPYCPRHTPLPGEKTDAAAKREWDKIAADFAAIPFEGHEARKLAFGYLRLRKIEYAAAELANGATGSGEEGFSRVPNELLWKLNGALEEADRAAE